MGRANKRTTRSNSNTTHTENPAIKAGPTAKLSNNNNNIKDKPPLAKRSKVDKDGRNLDDDVLSAYITPSNPLTSPSLNSQAPPFDLNLSSHDVAAQNSESSISYNDNNEIPEEEMLDQDQQPNQEYLPEPIIIPQQIEIALEAKYIPGRSPPKKVEKIKTTFSTYGNLNSVRRKALKQCLYVTAVFSDKVAADNACKHEFPFIDEDGNEVIHYFKYWTEIKPPMAPETKLLIDQRTIQVIDIPLNVQAALVRAVFTRYGNIEKLTMRTTKLFQHAFITFDSPDAIQPFFNDQWSEYILLDSVRIFPITLPESACQLRKDFGLKLGGIPPNFKAKNFLPFLNDLGAKTCFVPRNPNNYRQCRYAFVNFASQELADCASERVFSYEGHELFWCTQDEKTCHVCGRPDHEAKECPNKRKPKSENPYNKLYNRYKPAGHRKRPKSYADAAARNIDTTKNTNNHNKKGSTVRTVKPSISSDGNNKHKDSPGQKSLSTDMTIEALRGELQSLITQFNGIKEEVAAIRSMVTTQQSNPKSPATTNNTISKRKQGKRPIKEVETSDSDSDRGNAMNRLSTVESTVSALSAQITKLINAVTLKQGAERTYSSSFLGGNGEEIPFGTTGSK
ncbi:hypothetical protein C1645_829611 [Glomus cerebriforme]|uniref:CCHC-type domain-containing protein n=1 Tax=Glomus cerebriforme TaxID=658196 RepID=A0A397SJM1_9GLOM|nr:hypothetical protein C1645_829611 [Glomus cerebriforme]